LLEAPGNSKDFHKGDDHSGNPSGEASLDPAPTSHQTTDPKRERSKYEPTSVYRTRKGDRFSSLGSEKDDK
jgi:hypothetical protein